MGFIGRENELQQLTQTLKKKTSSFVVVKGRRRVGKSRLIEEFGKQFTRCHIFRGLAPTESTTQQSELDEFSRQISEVFGTAKATYDDWGNAFLAVAERVQTQKTLLVFDEISWMSTKDRTFLSKLKDFWDVHLKKNNQLVFVICGSAASWIDQNIMNHTGFVGRISFSLTVKEFSLWESRQFWPKNISLYEVLKVLCVTGGIPKYLEEVIVKEPAEKNIHRLCFTDGAILVNEFEQIFANTFLRESHYYVKVLEELSEGPKEIAQIQAKLGLETVGRLAEYCSELELAGFVTRDFTWKINSGEDSRLSVYRLKDNYIRFYLKYIRKNLNKIKRGQYAFKALSSLSDWNSVVGLQFENIVLNNRAALHKAVGINERDIVSENPYFQRKTQRQKGCQIDYMVQTRFGDLYVFEIKCSKTKVGAEVVEEVQNKIDALNAPKGFSYRPVLVHVNGVTKHLLEEDYFSEIVGVEALFEKA